MVLTALVHEHRVCLNRRRMKPFVLKRINELKYVVVHGIVGFDHNVVVVEDQFDAFGSDEFHRFAPSCAESRIVLSLHAWMLEYGQVCENNGEGIPAFVSV